MNSEKNIRWVVQSNLNHESVESIENACKRIGVECHTILVVPFETKLPEFTIDDKINIYFGSTTFMNNIYRDLKPVGLFYDHEAFTMQNYLNRYGKHMLSSEGRIITFGEFISENNAHDEKFFIRPNADDKSFSGQVMEFGNVNEWYNRIKKQYDNVNINENTLILVCEPYNITKEWRNYIVGGQIVTSSLYQKNSMVSKSRLDVPEEMLKFARERCAEYLPHQNVAMDIGMCGKEYYIIELGCLNSVGFYDADVDKMVEAITLNVEQIKKTT